MDHFRLFLHWTSWNIDGGHVGFMKTLIFLLFFNQFSQNKLFLAPLSVYFCIKVENKFNEYFQFFCAPPWLLWLPGIEICCETANLTIKSFKYSVHTHKGMTNTRQLTSTWAVVTVGCLRARPRTTRTVIQGSWVSACAIPEVMSEVTRAATRRPLSPCRPIARY